MAHTMVIWEEEVDPLLVTPESWLSLLSMDRPPLLERDGDGDRDLVGVTPRVGVLLAGPLPPLPLPPLPPLPLPVFPPPLPLPVFPLPLPLPPFPLLAVLLPLPLLPPPPLTDHVIPNAPV
jgi:hypothetical protein